jgi:hypothetical protein
MEFIKKYKLPKLPDTLVPAKPLKFLGEPIIPSFWLIDGRLMKTKDTQRMIKLIFHFTDM